MKLTFLGTGTSVGVPAIGCDCDVCRSDNPKNNRLRSSVYVETSDLKVIIDTTPDFRMQALRQDMRRVDAVLLTHSHADHILGFDDIRRFNTMQKCIIPVYGSPETIADMNRIFDYVHKEHLPGLYRPRVDFIEADGPFDVDSIHVEPFTVPHGPKATYGYLLTADGKTLGYFPDCHELPQDIIERLAGIDVMILDALKHTPHSTHLDFQGSLNALQKIGAKRSYLIHMCHDIDHDEAAREVPKDIYVSYDGLTVEW